MVAEVILFFVGLLCVVIGFTYEVSISLSSGGRVLVSIEVCQAKARMSEKGRGSLVMGRRLKASSSYPNQVVMTIRIFILRSVWNMVGNNGFLHLSPSQNQKADVSGRLRPESESETANMCRPALTKSK